eukprot:ANDGO_00880.mRNA.1 Small conductance calcium-activated potassium channel protein
MEDQVIETEVEKPSPLVLSAEPSLLLPDSTFSSSSSATSSGGSTTHNINHVNPSRSGGGGYSTNNNDSQSNESMGPSTPTSSTSKTGKTGKDGKEDEESLLHKLLFMPVNATKATMKATMKVTKFATMAVVDVTKRGTKELVNFSLNVTKRHKDLQNDLEAYKLMQMYSRAQVLFVIFSLTVLIGLQDGQYDETLSVSSENVLKIILLIASVLHIALIHAHYRAIIKVISSSGLLPQNASIYRANLIHWFLIEVGICSVFPYPFVNFGSLRTQQLFGCFVFTRVYLMGRFFYYRSYFTSATGRFVQGFTKMRFNVPFVIRVYLQEEPYVVLIGGFMVVLCSVSYMVWVAERLENPFLDSYSDCMWMVVVTIMTIGYGDRTPVTPEGRTIVLVGGFAGIMLTAMIITLFHRELQLTPQEAKLVSFLHNDKNNSRMRNLAASSIQLCWKLYTLKTTEITQDRMERFVMERVMQKHRLMVSEAERQLFLTLSSFRAVRRQMISDIISNSLDPTSIVEAVHMEVKSLQRSMDASQAPLEQRIDRLESQLSEILLLLRSQQRPVFDVSGL